MLTVTEVAKQFSVSRQTVLKWIKTGKIKGGFSKQELRAEENKHGKLLRKVEA